MTNSVRVTSRNEERKPKKRRHLTMLLLVLMLFLFLPDVDIRTYQEAFGWAGELSEMELKYLAKYNRELDDAFMVLLTAVAYDFGSYAYLEYPHWWLYVPHEPIGKQFLFALTQHVCDGVRLRILPTLYSGGNWNGVLSFSLAEAPSMCD